MGRMWYRVLVLPVVGMSLLATQQSKSQPKGGAASQAKGGAAVSGVFMGRSGKPMAKTRLFLGVIEKDEETLYATILLGDKPPSALTDDSGKFQFAGIAPGKYAILYQPPPNTQVVPPVQIDIKTLSVKMMPSSMPMLKGLELGKTGEPYPDRPWGAREFRLLKGHTLKNVETGGGTFMKVWNATVRRGASGPYLEMRNGAVVQQELADKSQIKVEAWGY